MKMTLAAVAALVTLAFSHPVHGHDHGQDDQWFQSLTNQMGGSCCDGSDFVRVEDPDWGIDGNDYWVKIDGEKHIVPKERLVIVPNKVGYAVVWPYHMDGKRIPRCFMPGAVS